MRLILIVLVGLGLGVQRASAACHTETRPLSDSYSVYQFMGGYYAERRLADRCSQLRGTLGQINRLVYFPTVLLFTGCNVTVCEKTVVSSGGASAYGDASAYGEADQPIDDKPLY